MNVWSTSHNTNVSLNSQDNNSSSNSSINNNSSLVCYETLDSVIPLIMGVEFWVSGVLVFIVGVLGVVANILTIVTLIVYEAKSSFNKVCNEKRKCNIERT